MYEWGKVKKVLGNKFWITIYSWTVWGGPRGQKGLECLCSLEGFEDHGGLGGSEGPGSSKVPGSDPESLGWPRALEGHKVLKVWDILKGQEVLKVWEAWRFQEGLKGPGSLEGPENQITKYLESFQIALLHFKLVLSQMQWLIRTHLMLQLLMYYKVEVTKFWTICLHLWHGTGVVE